MARIYNSDLSKELVEGAKLQQSADKIPQELAEKVVPVMETNPNLLRKIDVSKIITATNTTSATAYTTPVNKDFYLTNLVISLIKDATSESTSTYASMVINGLTFNGPAISSITLTAQSESLVLNLKYPLKIDQGTDININNSSAVANIVSKLSIFGYLVDNPLA